LIGAGQMWDLAPDGKRVAIMLGSQDNVGKPITQLTMLLGFFDEVRRRTGRGE